MGGAVEHPGVQQWHRGGGRSCSACTGTRNCVPPHLTWPHCHCRTLVWAGCRASWRCWRWHVRRCMRLGRAGPAAGHACTIAMRTLLALHGTIALHVPSRLRPLPVQPRHHAMPPIRPVPHAPCPAKQTHCPQWTSSPTLSQSWGSPMTCWCCRVRTHCCVFVLLFVLLVAACSPAGWPACWGCRVRHLLLFAFTFLARC